MSRPFELIDKPTIQVVALVLEDSRGNILLTQRKKGKHLAGYWEFPGGKVEPEETLSQALCREIKEELNYQPTNFSHLLTVKHQYPEKKVEIYFYKCIDDARPTPMEQQKMQWVHKSALTATKLPPANLPVLKVI